jgi:hypothetical protein
MLPACRPRSSTNSPSTPSRPGTRGRGAGLLIAVPGVEAATYCVGSPASCSGIDVPGNGTGLQQAFDQASANGESDSVRIGPGTYTPPEPGGFEVVSPAHGIVIRGSGSDQTILEGLGPSAVPLDFTGAAGDSSNVRNVAVRLSDDGGTPIGLLMSGAGTSSVVVTAPAGVTAGQGVRLAGQSTLESTKVITPGLNGVETIGDATVASSLIAANASGSRRTCLCLLRGPCLPPLIAAPIRTAHDSSLGVDFQARTVG